MKSDFNRKMIIENDILLIRTLTIDDANALFEIYADAESMKFRGSKSFENIAQAIDMIHKTKVNIESKIEFRYGIIEKKSNELMGSFLIIPISNKSCKIGLSFGRKYWQLGFGSQTLKLMIHYMKNQGFETLIGLIKKENIGSLKLFEKLNFKRIEQNEIPEFYKYEFQIIQ